MNDNNNDNQNDIENKNENSKEKIGEIVYYGKNVFWGYSKSYNDLKEYKKNNYALKTGDLGYLDKRGLLYITGREKRILKIFGISLQSYLGIS